MNLSTIEQTAKSDLSWLQRHERILIVTLLIVTTLFLGNRFLSNIAAKDKLVADVAVQQLNAQKEQNTQLAAQVKQTSDQYQALIITLTQQNAQLAAAQQQRTVVLQQQVKTDNTMSLPDLGTRWAKLASLAPTDITASTSGITVSDMGARQTVVQLEQVPVLQQNLSDEQTVADNRLTELTKANDLIGGLKQQVVGLNVTVTEQDKTCKAEITSVKASARKGKFKAFLTGVGVGAGVVTALVIHTLLL